MKFFFDNNVRIKLAMGLNALEVSSSPVHILHCRERWPPDGAIDDVDWIPQIARVDSACPQDEDRPDFECKRFPSEGRGRCGRRLLDELQTAVYFSNVTGL